jgi:hypothetical protein
MSKPQHSNFSLKFQGKNRISNVRRCFPGYSQAPFCTFPLNGSCPHSTLFLVPGKRNITKSTIPLHQYLIPCPYHITWPCPTHPRYLTTLCSHIASKDNDLREEALSEIRTSKRLSLVLPYLLHFIDLRLRDNVLLSGNIIQVYWGQSFLFCMYLINLLIL